ncbi:hypothetical protein ACFWB8_27660, partial [Streptomyces sp. NPDC060031]
PMTYVFKGAGAGISKIGDVMAGFKGIGKIDLPAFPEGALALPEGSFKLPDGNFHLPEGAKMPEGAVKLPDGNFKLPEGTTALPPNTVRLPVDGPPQFMDPKGNIYDADGAVTSHAKDAPTGHPATSAELPKVEAPAKVPVLVGAGHVGDNAFHVGDDLTGPGQHTPGGTANHPIGGTVDNTVHNSHTPGGGGGNTHTPGTHTSEPVTTGGGHHGAGDGPAVPHQGDGPGGTGHGGHGGPGGGFDDAAHAGDDAAHAGDDAAHAGDDAAHAGDDAAHAGDDATPAGQHGDNGAPAGERELTTAERKRLQDEHVWKANNDPEWFKEHYRPGDGHRLSKSAKVDGVELPILAKDANGNWISKYDMPSGPSETKFGRTPLGTAGIDPVHLTELDKAAKNRSVAMELNNAQKAFDENPTVANTDRLNAAKVDYTKHLDGVPNNSKIGERLGEEAAVRHVVPHEFPTAKPIDLPQTGNGANMFDGAYELPNDEFLIVEAKAPNANLDWRQGVGDVDPRVTGPQGLRVKQGTRLYVETILSEMWKRGGKDAEIADKLFDALEDGKLKYVMVKANENTGSYAGAVMEHLKI